MGRLMALDYGLKRCGLAVSDPLQIIATPLKTVDTRELLTFLMTYTGTEQVDCLIVGQPFRSSGELSAFEQEIVAIIDQIQAKLPGLPIARQDEQFSSRRAMEGLIASGVRKSERRNKELLDSTAATLILQDFMAKQA